MLEYSDHGDHEHVELLMYGDWCHDFYAALTLAYAVIGMNIHIYLLRCMYLPPRVVTTQLFWLSKLAPLNHSLVCDEPSIQLRKFEKRTWNSNNKFTSYYNTRLLTISLLSVNSKLLLLSTLSLLCCRLAWIYMSATDAKFETMSDTSNPTW